MIFFFFYSPALAPSYRGLNHISFRTQPHAQQFNNAEGNAGCLNTAAISHSHFKPTQGRVEETRPVANLSFPPYLLSWQIDGAACGQCMTILTPWSFVNPSPVMVHRSNLACRLNCFCITLFISSFCYYVWKCQCDQFRATVTLPNTRGSFHMSFLYHKRAA